MSLDIRNYMNLCELKPSHAKHLMKTDDWTPLKLKDWLDNNGYYSTGKLGAYSQVFTSNSSNIVIKISHSQDNAWLWYANYCMQNKSNPYLLKIGSIKTYQYQKRLTPIIPSETSGRPLGSPKTLFIAFMEKLSPIEDNELYNMGWEDFEAIYLLNVNDEHINFKLAANYYEKHEDFCNTLLDIKNKKPAQYTMDLHTGNFMKRGNQLVITDPLED